MSDENEQKKEHSRISVRMGEFQIELEGAHGNVKKLMGKELVDFIKGLQETKKQLPPSTEITPGVTLKVTPKEETVPPPSRPSTTPAAVSQPSRVPAIGKPTEKKGQKKIVGRRVAIALGMICIVLAAGLVSAIAVYMPMVNSLESQIAEKDNTILSLNSQVSSLNSQVSSLQNSLEESNTNIAALQETLQVLNSRIQYYLSIIYLNESGYLLQPATQTLTQNASAFTIVYNDIIEYAGYVSVAVESSSNTTYAQVTYSSYGVNYDHNVTVRTSGTAVFPVLPGEILVGVGNTETAGNVTATVTAIYRY